MTDETPRPKRMGRPPKHPDQGKRPSLSLRVSQALYDQIVVAAAENGRSLSEEMEARVMDAFNQSQPQAVAKAVDSALWEAGEEQVVEAGGKLGFVLNSIHRRHLGGIMLEAHEKFGVDSAKALTQEFIEFVFTRLDKITPQIKKEWTQRIVLTKIVSSWSDPDVQAEINKLSEDNPDLFQAFIERFGR